jgi:hypothetical protein
MEPIYLSVDGNYDGGKENLNYFRRVEGICHQGIETVILYCTFIILYELDGRWKL